MKKRILFFVSVALSVVSCLNDPQVYEPASGPEFPVFGEWTSSEVEISEFSSLCLNKDGSALFAVCDKGYLYSLAFDGTLKLLYDAHENDDYDFEAVTLDPSTGDVYLGVERSQKILKLCAPYSSVSAEWTVDTGANDPSGRVTPPIFILFPLLTQQIAEPDCVFCSTGGKFTPSRTKNVRSPLCFYQDPARIICQSIRNQVELRAVSRIESGRSRGVGSVDLRSES